MSPDPKVETRTARQIADAILQFAWMRFGYEQGRGHGQQWCDDVWTDAEAHVAAALQAERDRAAGLEKALQDIAAERFGSLRTAAEQARAALAERERRSE